MSTTAVAAPETGRTGKMTGMEEMASSMTAMADMCREMMQREAAMRPYKMAAAVSLGGLLLVALVLFVVLEVYWIRHWRRVVNTQDLNS